MTKTILFSGIILLISHGLFGQTDFYLGFSGTYSFIPKTEIIDNSSFTDPFGNFTSIKLTESFDVDPGFNLDFGFSRQFIDKFSINSGCGFSFISYKRESRLDLIEDDVTINLNEQSGIPIQDFYGIQLGDIRFQDINSDFNDTIVSGNPNYGKTKILYLVLPVKIQYSILPDRFKIGIGVTNYFIAYSSQIKSIIDYETLPISYKEYNDKSSDGLNNYQLNGTFSLEYKVFKGIWIQTSYNHGFLSIYDKRPQSNYPSVNVGKEKYRTIELGLKYVL